MLNDITIREMVADDIDRLARTFAPWNKSRAQFVWYFAEHTRGYRVVLVAAHGDEVVGYTLLIWRSRHPAHREAGIPEIVDLNVLTQYQRQGIGSALIATAERLTAARGLPMIGIGVVLSPEYVVAHRLYLNLGFVPEAEDVPPGKVLYLKKPVRSET